MREERRQRSVGKEGREGGRRGGVKQEGRKGDGRNTVGLPPCGHPRCNLVVRAAPWSRC